MLNIKCLYIIQQTLIIKHIKKYIIENSIDSYVLSWFGGEPLTQPKAIDFISSELYSFCVSHNVDYSAGITTNGALLNAENIKMLIRNKVNYYQIAIDGDEKTHNQNKHDKNSNNSFALILNNVARLLRLNEKVEVVLRLNYTLVTLKSGDLLDDICKYVPSELRCRIKVDLQKVWQIKEEKVKIDDLRALQERFVNAGFRLCTEHVFSICYVEKEHYLSFGSF